MRCVDCSKSLNRDPHFAGMTHDGSIGGLLHIESFVYSNTSAILGPETSATRSPITTNPSELLLSDVVPLESTYSTDMAVVLADHDIPSSNFFSS